MNQHQYPWKLVALFSLVFQGIPAVFGAVPSTFTDLKDVDATIVVDMAYAGRRNFVGRPIPGYDANRCLLTGAAARALARAQTNLRTQGFGLKVLDCYRPKTAVDYFVQWARNPRDDGQRRSYYPDIRYKQDLLNRGKHLGYIASVSAHSRGSTVDATLVHFETGIELDMGAPFDFFGAISHTASRDITPAQRANRRTLGSALVDAGFYN